MPLASSLENSHLKSEKSGSLASIETVNKEEMLSSCTFHSFLLFQLCLFYSLLVGALPSPVKPAPTSKIKQPEHVRTAISNCLPAACKPKWERNRNGVQRDKWKDRVVSPIGTSWELSLFREMSDCKTGQLLPYRLSLSSSVISFNRLVTPTGSK